MVEILNETRQALPLEDFERILGAYLEDAGVRQDVTVVLVDDEAMRERNLRDRGEDEATDVLSYPTFEPDDAMMPLTEHLGDVFISVDTARRQAPEHGQTLLEELLTLAAHGITHLRGHDHPTEAAWQTFRDAETRIVDLARGGG